MDHPKHLILTVKNLPHLTKVAVQAIPKAIKKIFRRSFYKERVRGGLLALEVTNIGNGWHPHAHVLLDSQFLPFKKLKQEWQALTGGSVHIKDHDGCRGIAYLLKYVGKAPDIYRVDGGCQIKRYCDREEKEERDAVFNIAMKGVRMVQSFGVIYGKEKPKPVFLTCIKCGGTEWMMGMELQGLIDRAQIVEPEPPWRIIRDEHHDHHREKEDPWDGFIQYQDPEDD